MRWLSAATLFLSACIATLSTPSDEFRTALATSSRLELHGRPEAEEAYREAIRVADRQKDKEEAMYRLSRFLHESGRTRESLVLLEEIIAPPETGERTARARFDAALYTEELGDIADATRRYREFYRLHPDTHLAERALQLFIRHSHPNEVDPILENDYRDLRETSLSDELLWQQVLIADAQCNRTRLRERLESLIANHPYPFATRWDNAILRLAQLELEESHPAQAIHHLDTLLAFAEPGYIVGSYTQSSFPGAALLRARIYRDHVRDWSKAEEAFLFVADAFPRSRVVDDALVETGEMWLAAGNPDRGCAMLQEAVQRFEVGSARRRAANVIETQCPQTREE